MRILALIVGLFLAVRVSAAEPLHVHFLSGSKEYRSNESLKDFAKELTADGTIRATGSWSEDKAKSIDGLDELAKADVLVVYARRLDLPEEQMEVIREHWRQGKPVVGIRTASHAFQEKDNRVFDREVLGNHYDGHYGDEPFEVETTAAGRDHPVLQGVGDLRSHRLYKAGELPPGTTVLQTGDIGKRPQAVTLTSDHQGARTFYTSLGLPEDFQVPAFQRLLRNAILWVAERGE